MEKDFLQPKRYSYEIYQLTELPGPSKTAKLDHSKQPNFDPLDATHVKVFKYAQAKICLFVFRSAKFTKQAKLA